MDPLVAARRRRASGLPRPIPPRRDPSVAENPLRLLRPLLLLLLRCASLFLERPAVVGLDRDVLPVLPLPLVDRCCTSSSADCCSNDLLFLFVGCGRPLPRGRDGGDVSSSLLSSLKLEATSANVDGFFLGGGLATVGRPPLRVVEGLPGRVAVVVVVEFVERLLSFSFSFSVSDFSSSIVAATSTSDGFLLGLEGLEGLEGFDAVAVVVADDDADDVLVPPLLGGGFALMEPEGVGRRGLEDIFDMGS